MLDRPTAVLCIAQSTRWRIDNTMALYDEPLVTPCFFLF